MVLLQFQYDYLCPKGFEIKNEIFKFIVIVVHYSQQKEISYPSNKRIFIDTLRTDL